MANNDAARTDQIIDVFLTEFGELMRADPNAFHRKFRKMAASPFAFYRGSACLFYADVHAENDTRYCDDHTSRVWIHGDLHAENFGTYMNANGILVFNVNDFDEAYVGPFMWDLKRFAASVALVAYSKALSDDDINQLVNAFGHAYLDELRHIVDHGDDSIGELTIENTEGALRAVLQDARLGSRMALLNSQTEIVDYDRRFGIGDGVYEVAEADREKVREAYQQYLASLHRPEGERVPEKQIKDIALRKGVGIGSAGLPSYNLLMEGNTQALENDILVYMKQAQVPAVSRVIDDARVTDYFKHQGHRTADSQRALQAHADPWCGYTELDGVGQFCAEVSPYAADLDWSALDEPDEMEPVITYLGRAVARMHSVADADSEHSLIDFSTEDAIAAAIGDDDKGFCSTLVDFAHQYGNSVRRDHQLFVDLFRNDKLPTQG